jgi:transcriptional regulator with XRE-family HTH domain
LRHRRKELDLSQDQLADRVGCSQGAVSAWELGKGTIREKRHRRLLEALFDCTTAELEKENDATEGDAVVRTEVPPNSRYAQR